MLWSPVMRRVWAAGWRVRFRHRDPIWKARVSRIHLDDVRSGKSKYVTLACNPSNYKKFYNMGSFKYKSIIDDKTYTLNNLVGYYHDTGSAFTDAGCAKNRRDVCPMRNRHFDVAYGDFRGKKGKEKYANGGVCAKTTQPWKQIGDFVTK